jgi:hypothetical protein
MNKITLNKSEMIKFVSMIVEQVNLEGYNDEDFVEVFVNLFRPWVKSKHGDEVGKYPMSYLIKKYVEEFASDNKIQLQTYYGGGELKRIVNIGRDIVRKGDHQLPSLNTNTKFTERFKKPLLFLVDNLKLPDFINLQFDEETPNRVRGEIVVDFPKMIKSSNGPKSPYRISQKLQKSFEDYLGVEFGSPVHGKLDFYLNTTPTYVGLDEWIKKELNKNIKKQIKELPLAERNISSLKFILNTNNIKGEIKVGWKRDARWGDHHKVKEEVRNILKSMGYNLEVLEVTST